MSEAIMHPLFELNERDRTGAPKTCYIQPTYAFRHSRIVIDIPHDVSIQDAINIAKEILRVAIEEYAKITENAEVQIAAIEDRLNK